MKTVLFAMVMAASLAACGKKVEEKAAQPAPAASAQPAASAASEPAKTEPAKK